MGLWDSKREKLWLDKVAEYYTREGESPVVENQNNPSSIPSSTGHVKSRVNQPRPRGKAKYSCVTDSEKYREGKVKRTPDRGVKKNMKPLAYKQWKADLTANRVPVEE